MIKLETVTVPINVLDEGVNTPRYAYSGDAGTDLCANEELTLDPFERSLVKTGLRVAIPEGYAGFVLPRSGLSSKHGITVVNAPGLIDSNYRGEVQIALINLDAHNSFIIRKGDRIAQLVILATPSVNFSPCDQLDDSQRGGKGFGSSGL